MSAEVVIAEGVGTCPRANDEEPCKPCTPRTKLNEDYLHPRMCQPHEIHWEAYWGRCWALELRLLRARAEGIRSGRTTAIVTEAELHFELLWNCYLATRDYTETKERFEQSMSKSEDLIHRLEVRERLGWSEKEPFDFKLQLNAGLLIKAAGGIGTLAGNAETE